jgi:hypothetical protein
MTTGRRCGPRGDVSASVIPRKLLGDCAASGGELYH